MLCSSQGAGYESWRELRANAEHFIYSLPGVTNSRRKSFAVAAAFAVVAFSIIEK